MKTWNSFVIAALLVSAPAIRSLHAGSTIQFAVGTKYVQEDAGTVDIAVVRSGDLTGVVTVDYATSNLTATAGADYVAASGTLTFTNGQAQQTVTLTILNDGVVEGLETFRIYLFNPGGAATLGGLRFATVAINDNDLGFRFESATYEVAENAGSITVTVLRGGDFIEPAAVDYTTANGTALAGADYTAVSGTLAFALGETNKTITVPILNDALREGTEYFKLSLLNPTVPGSLGLHNVATVSILDNDAGIQFDNTAYQTPEFDGVFRVNVSRQDDLLGPATVDYTTRNLTAAAGADYVATSGTLMFGSGETNKTIDVTILNDGLVEGNETFQLVLSNPSGGESLGIHATATVTILDNDTGFQFANDSFFVDENAGSALITVNRGDDLNTPVSVDYFTSDLTAMAGLDYLAASGTLTFQAGDRQKSFSVPILGDGLVETNETVQLTLSNPLGGVSLGARRTATLTISNDDSGIQFESPYYSIAENGGAAVITVIRGYTGTNTVTVDYATSNLTATAGLDYVATSGTLTFAAGENAKSFTVPILDDTLVEGDETVQLILTNPTGGALLGGPRMATLVATLVIIDDDIDSFNPGANGSVLAFALQADGQILVGGAFYELGGYGRSCCIGRLNAEGLVAGFNPRADNPVLSLALQADGKVVAGGQFTWLAGQSRNSIGRLNADGTLDATFNPGANSSVYSVSSIALQADGKILVGGYFTMLGGQSRANVGRLNADGTLDASFNPEANDVVLSLALQDDGKILVGGYFTTLGGQGRNRIGRLNADGTLDTGFNPGADGEVLCMALQADGKILVGGYFATLGGQSRDGIGRLNTDGTLDTSFNPDGGGVCYSLALQADGKILVGAFGVFRLNADGTPDESFYAWADNEVDSLAVQSDGKVLVGGSFNTLVGESRNYIGRLNNTGPATQSLTFDGSTLTWMRGGTSPEVWRTTFEYSPDGASWTNLGGIRIPGGWQLTGLAMPTNTTFRARGYTVGGSGIVETMIGPPVVITQPTSLTNDAGTTARFSVGAIGPGALSYQWRKDKAKLVDSGNVSGATSFSLSLSNVLGDNAGGYSVVISDAYGSVTSSVAMLTVIDPVISVQPASQAGNPSDSVSFYVVAIGTAPLSYQWRKDGGLLAGATQSWLTLTNLQGLDAGSSYDVVVSNAWGSVTSAMALLSVNLALPDSFNPGANGAVYSLAVQADGKILVGGYFTTLGGQSRNHIGRLDADGTLDTSFNPGASDSVACLAVQADGKILVGGFFTTLGGQSRNHIGRLNADGTLDNSFDPGAGGVANSYVFSLAMQADGKILVGGFFTTLGGQSRICIGRLNADGTLDTSFNPGAEGDYQFVSSLAMQVDGKILVGGSFTTPGGQSRNYIGRFNSDGTLDTSFNSLANNPVLCLAVQADGKILAGGYFTTLGGQSIGRLNTDGTLDTDFNPGADSTVFSLALQADGKILAGGYFATLGGRNYIGRLNTDGMLDAGFIPGANDAVHCLALQSDGKILVGGNFNILGGQSRNYIGRLNNTGPATQSLTFDGSTLTWTRGGTSPEVWRTTFEYSPDGALWTNLGNGIRIPGGWQLTGLALPMNTTLRARGFTTGGKDNGSSYFVETVLRPPLAISNFRYSTHGQFEFDLTGPAGQFVVIEAARDLKTWTALQTNMLGADLLSFGDPQSGTFSHRFYRARTP